MKTLIFLALVALASAATISKFLVTSYDHNPKRGRRWAYKCATANVADHETEYCYERPDVTADGTTGGETSATVTDVTLKDCGEDWFCSWSDSSHPPDTEDFKTLMDHDIMTSANPATLPPTSYSRLGTGYRAKKEKCWKAQDIGFDCSHDRHCKSMKCVESVCVDSRPGEGEHCTWDDPASPKEHNCRGGLDCWSHICAERYDENELCAKDEHCKTGYVCDTFQHKCLKRMELEDGKSPLEGITLDTSKTPFSDANNPFMTDPPAWTYERCASLHVLVKVNLQATPIPGYDTPTGDSEFFDTATYACQKPPALVGATTTGVASKNYKDESVSPSGTLDPDKYKVLCKYAIFTASTLDLDNQQKTRMDASTEFSGYKCDGNDIANNHDFCMDVMKAGGVTDPSKQKMIYKGLLYPTAINNGYSMFNLGPGLPTWSNDGVSFFCKYGGGEDIFDNARKALKEYHDDNPKCIRDRAIGCDEAGSTKGKVLLNKINPDHYFNTYVGSDACVPVAIDREYGESGAANFILPILTLAGALAAFFF